MIVKDWWTVEFIDILIDIDRQFLYCAEGDQRSLRAQIDEFLEVRTVLATEGRWS